jgi:hypothetical protein
MSMNGLGTRVAGTIIVGVGWLVFLILYLAFYAGSFNIWQNLAIFLASLLISGGLIAALWVVWALRR